MLCLCMVFFAGSQAFGQSTAAFKADHLSGCAPLTVSFENESKGSNLTYYWQFGNGNTSTTKDPQAIYYQPGKYTVKLTVTDASTKEIVEEKLDYIQVFKSPVANLTGSPLTGCAPRNVVFKSTSQKGDGAITKYVWDFGDGNTNTGANDVPLHRYTIGGKFSVSLEVEDENGCTDEAIKVNYVSIDKTPVVDFKADNRFSCTAPLTVQFTSTTINSSSGDQYHWDFGDGNTSTDKNPSHQYTSKGKYSVSLRVTTSNGCSDEEKKVDFIVIGDLEPDFTVSETEGCAPLRVVLRENINPKVSGLTYEWRLSDGTFLTGPVISVDLADKGLYDVKLTVSYKNGCKEEISKSGVIRVLEKPVAKMEYDDSAACKAPFIVNFKDKSTGAISFEWFFPDHIDTKSKNPTYAFTTAGSYSVKLVVKNAGGCTDTTGQSTSFQIKGIDTMLFTSELEGCEKFEVNFDDSSTCVDPIVSWQWDFGDGTKGSGKSVKHAYDSGTYTAKIVLTTGEGCKDSMERIVHVGVKSNPDFKKVQDTLCNNVMYEFENRTDTSIDIRAWEWYLNDEMFSEFEDGQLFTDHDTGWYDVKLVADNNGCKDSIIKKNQIYILPPKAVILSDMDSCNQDTINLRNRTKIYDIFYWVNMDDGQRYYDSVIQIVPQVNDTIQYILYAEDTVTKCWDNERYAVVINNFYEAKFDVTGDRCAPATLSFKNNSTGASFVSAWYEEDSTQHISDDLFLEFSSSGNFKVKLVIVSDDGTCSDTLEEPVTITGPTVDGEVTPKGLCLPFRVTLDSDDKLADFNELYWLVDGERVEKTNNSLEIEIKEPGSESDGSVKIELIGIDSNGCRGSEEFLVPTKGPKDFGIQMSLKVDDCSHRTNIYAIRWPGGTTPSDKDKYKVKWNMGDNSNEHDLYAFTHTYEKDGDYLVKLTIEDENGCITVLDSLVSPKNRKLRANFSGDNFKTDCPPHFVNFKNESTLSIGRISRYLWDFGDGSYSEEKNPSHNYLFAGRFTVKLVVWDQWGCVDSLVFPDLVIVNGPIGTYTFDKDEGCVPLEVNFEAEVDGANLMEWDMGDGIVVKNQPTYTHTYTDTGRFIPLMVLKDTFGCKYIMPPIDSIYVYPYPEPNFSYTIACAGDPINFKNLTKSTADITSCEWDFGDGQSSPECDPSHVFETAGVYAVKLTSTNEFGCAQTITKTVKVYGINADFTHTGNAICLDDTIYIVDQSSSDTNIISHQWFWEVGNTSTSFNPKMKFETIGPKWITLIVRDELGCTDTLKTDKILIVGDTVIPLPTQIHRVSVVDDYSNLVEVKSSNIVDFKGYRLYRLLDDGSYKLEDETFAREDTVLYAYGLDTRNESYCYKIRVVNTCNLLSDLDAVDIHCTVNCGVQADTNKNIVRWSDYVGWPRVDEFVINRESETNNGVYFPIDSVLGSTFEFTDTTVSCHTEHHYRIMAKYNNQKMWLSNSDTCGGQPVWVNRVPAPEVIRVTVVDNEFTQLDWKLLLNSQTPISYYLVEKSDDGRSYSSFSDNFPQGSFSLQDKEVDVNSRPYWYRMRAVDECNDTGGYSNLAKSVYLQVDTNADDRPMLDWSHYIHWDEGVSHYEIQRKEEDGSFTSMGNTLTGLDTQYVDEISDWLLRPNYCYRVIAYSQEDTFPKVVSISNEDCAPIRSRIYVPNAFSPNDDQLNDGFRPVCLYIRNYHMTIYNRWGQQVFESTNPYDRWDGTYEGEASEPGVFIYLIEALGADLVKYNLRGSFHLVK